MSLELYIHYGASALSDFRSHSLASKIGAEGVKAQYVHYVALKEGISLEEQALLDELLTYDDVPTSRPIEKEGAGNLETFRFYVVPRKGTISPWSSKATSIAYVCGFKNKVRRIERGVIFYVTTDKETRTLIPTYTTKLYDRMTQALDIKPPSWNDLFAEPEAKPAEILPILGQGDNARVALEKVRKSHGLVLDSEEIDYLLRIFGENGSVCRNPYLEEIFMFSQLNSDHCRHKQFNAAWAIDGLKKPYSLFDMIRNTHQKSPQGIISAYKDNAAVCAGPRGSFLAPDRESQIWKETRETVNYLGKVETHNHPTAVSPHPGAATGSGGEIRDEGSVGRGSRPKAGLCGFAVSDLNIPNFQQPWEIDIGKPNHIASALDIMIDAPLGSAQYNNEFGRPCTTGFFRTYLMDLLTGSGSSELRGYHKPIMVAGGVGVVRPQMSLKDPGVVPSGAVLVVLGGPAMLIGLGGGAASSVVSSEENVELDFASVQRANAEVQRRAQEVINACAAMGRESPILFIHDVGAGGLSNALPELVHDSNLGATFDLRQIDSADSSMKPYEIWSCEAQERYVLAVAKGKITEFGQIAKRERCGYSIVGRTTSEHNGEDRLILRDQDFESHPTPIDVPMSFLFEKLPKMQKNVGSRRLRLPAFDSSLSVYLPDVPTNNLLEEAVDRVLGLPSVGSKNFLITIGDRTVGGLTARDQMVGKWQTPVADVSVTATSLTLGIKTGEAMAMGEKPTLALISPAASARMAVAESLMNIAAAELDTRLSKVCLSANWMSASSHAGEGAAIYEAVEAIGMQLCPDLGISIPVGKDSMSMKMSWTDKATKVAKEVTAPLSLVVTAFAPVLNITKTWTPALRRLEDVGETIILVVDLARGRQALGGSALTQVFGQIGDTAPDVHDVQLLKDYFDAMEQLQEAGIVLAYHDKTGDGGLFTALVEMIFAGRCGMDLMLDSMCSSHSLKSLMETLWNEELGGVFQIRKQDETEFHRCFATCGPPPGLIKKIGRVSSSKKQELTIYHGHELLYRGERAKLQQRWASTSFQMQRLRDNPTCADAEFSSIADSSDPGLSYNLTFDPTGNIQPTLSGLMNSLSLTSKPRVAILREQGVNGQTEMAFAFMTAGFIAVDVHMTDLIEDRVTLNSFVGLAACGGFSYGDVLGAGR